MRRWISPLLSSPRFSRQSAGPPAAPSIKASFINPRHAAVLPDRGVHVGIGGHRTAPGRRSTTRTPRSPRRCWCPGCWASCRPRHWPRASTLESSKAGSPWTGHATGGQCGRRQRRKASTSVLEPDDRCPESSTLSDPGTGVGAPRSPATTTRGRTDDLQAAPAHRSAASSASRAPATQGRRIRSDGCWSPPPPAPARPAACWPRRPSKNRRTSSSVTY